MWGQADFLLSGKKSLGAKPGDLPRMNALHSMRSSQLLRHNAVFLAGSLAVGALNYLYYPVIGRMVEPGTFGEIQTLVSLFLQLGVFLTVLGTVIVNIVANYDQAKRNEFVFEFEKLAMLGGLAILIVSLIFARQLQSALNFESPLPFAILALAVLASVPFYIRGAYLRGRQSFGKVSAGNIVTAGAKLVLSAVLVAAGLGTIGAIGGILLAQILACVLVMWWAYKAGLLSAGARKFRPPNLKLLAPELRFGGVVLAASLAITLQYSIDIVLIKYYFDAETAGLYAGVAAVARILFFLTASIAQVLISKVKMNDSAVHSENILHKSLLMLTVISLPVLVCTVLLPEQTIRLLMGNTYVALSGLLPMLSISVFLVAVINLIAAYALALRRFSVALLVVVGAAFTYLFIFLHHGSPKAIVESLLLGSAATILSLGVWKIMERRYGA
jgi:O-antigen/teichoic acid export membrane protein